MYGVFTARKPIIKRTTLRLKANYYLNTLERAAIRSANSAAALVFLYLVVGKSMNYIFEEELDGLPLVMEDTAFKEAIWKVMESTAKSPIEVRVR